MGSNAKEDVQTCLVCGCVQTQEIGVKVTTRPFTIVRCALCHMVYAVPRPTAAELKAFYGHDYFEGGSKRYDSYQSCAEVNARRMWTVLNSWYPLERAPNRRLLDVGTATGGFLSEAQADGWDVEGVELSNSAAAVARDAGLKVHTGDVQTAHLEGGFGLVTMWHIVEHLIDPAEGVRLASEQLAPRGLLLIEMPNWNSVGRIVKGLNWSALTPPEHINYFAPKTLTRLVTNLGLRVVKIQTPPHRFPTKRPVSRAAMNAVGHLLGAAGYGGYVRLMARRPI
jgi:2-polyprenyl-3-methyl-5-hydroxy-6-metoxy-1,4-benzoquinol methylase